MHIYAFGSVCRGDVSFDSDVDLLAIVNGVDFRFDPAVYSVYSYHRIEEIWREGNPFAWHLALESRMVYTSDGSDFLGSLGKPAAYARSVADCIKFYSLFAEASKSLESSSETVTFDLSVVFLSIRNFATCFSLGLGTPDFSRHSARRIGQASIPIEPAVYDIFERARILCTRGRGMSLRREEVDLAIARLPQVDEWMNRLLKLARAHE